MNLSVKFAALLTCLLFLSETTLGQLEDITVSDPYAAAKAQAELLSSVRQLTFDGKRAAKAISARWPLDGLQSEREADNPFFQIYLMDRETGDTHRVSQALAKRPAPGSIPIIIASCSLRRSSTPKPKPSSKRKSTSANLARRSAMLGTTMKRTSWSSTTSRKANTLG